MTNIYTELTDIIEKAIASATMENAQFGFTNDRITIKSSHFNGQGFATGQDVHPTEFIVQATKLYRDSWIIGRLEHALTIIKNNAELFERATELAQALEKVDLERINHIAGVTIKQSYP